MRFTEEDKILTATQARARSVDGTEDSLIREPVREAMAYIRRSSLYGYNETQMNSQRKMSDTVMDELKSFGYKVHQEESSYQYLKKSNGVVLFDITISW